MLIVINLLHLYRLLSKMSENNKEKLHAIIVEISKLSNDIDELKKKREELLDQFKQLQSNEDEPGTVINLR